MRPAANGRLLQTVRATDPRNSLSRQGRQSSKQAKATADREAVCTAMPGFEDALAAGGVAAGHVDAIAHATRHLDDELLAEFAAAQDDLLTDAGRMSVDGFERHCRDLARQLTACRTTESDADELDRQRAESRIERWVDQPTGMCHTHIVMDPVSDREFWSAVQQHRSRLRRRPQNRNISWHRLTVDALVAAVEPGDAQGRRHTRISIHVDLATITSGLRARSICETDNGTPLPVSTVRRLACEAQLVPVVLNGEGVALDLGRSRRFASTDQRIAIESMHRTCVHPDCQVGIDDCRIHHTREWAADLGATDLEDLAPVCETHHHLVHEGGWGLTVTTDRVATWTMPDGTTYWSGPTNDRATIAA